MATPVWTTCPNINVDHCRLLFEFLAPDFLDEGIKMGEDLNVHSIKMIFRTEKTNMQK
jgi:hypothetical protein